MERTIQLDNVLAILRTHEGELRQKGVARAAVFGSVARGQSTGTSDIDVMIDLDPNNIPSLFTYLGIARELETWLGYPVDLAVRTRLKRFIRPHAEAEAVYAF
jgi:predicted nucleotidyltransferase